MTLHKKKKERRSSLGTSVGPATPPPLLLLPPASFYFGPSPRLLPSGAEAADLPQPEHVQTKVTFLRPLLYSYFPPNLLFSSKNVLLKWSMSAQNENPCQSSSSSLNSSFQDTDDDVTIPSVLPEETFNQIGNLGRRLSHLSSIPHTPRINGEIPDLDDATLDHERLSERLATYGLAELQIEGDGNCQFRALADQLFRNPNHHRHVRRQVVKQLKKFQKSYEGYVPMKYKDYLKKMKGSGEWGDHVTLQAAADRFEAKICLLTSFRDTCFIEIVPKEKSPTKELWLSFWSEVHYNSLYGADDLPTRPMKKKYWLF